MAIGGGARRDKEESGNEKPEYRVDGFRVLAERLGVHRQRP